MKKPLIKLGMLSLAVSLLLTGLFVVHANQEQQWRSTEDSRHLSVQQTNDAIQQLMSDMDSRLNLNPNDHEASLMKGFFYFKQGDFTRAVDELNQLTRRAPEFHLAHLVYGDMLMAKVGVVSDVGNSPVLQELDKRLQEQLRQLRDEAQYRLQAHLARPHETRIPKQLLRLGKSVDKAVLVEKQTHRLYIYQRSVNNEPPLKVYDYYVSTGRKEGDKNVRGDLRTPEGVYFITSWIPEEKLPDKYGVGAFPVNYPNEWDRRLGKTGDGIWLHGTESRYYSRPPLDSEGCVVLTNIDLDFIKKEVKPGITPVIIAERLDWMDRSDWLQQQNEVLQAIERWRQDWESLDVERYLQHYATDFWSRGFTLSSWSQRKRRLARQKTFQRVAIDDLSLFAYPDTGNNEGEMVVARFQQRYRSNNYHSDVRKQLYLNHKQGRWQIMYEGS